ncbi:hypothetical protein [Aggregatibacter actinomycetemcomitans]|uniref:hypothetical protein n=1 Tax=Aggregatibacter actinomycetemcomitans TaxID=714 RepID=UPI001E35371E|nr:hypothetical protein [Aggregatibacter actinomycetemcomitans]
MTTQKYEKTPLRFEIFHTIKSVADYVNNRDDIADIIAADYALIACEESGYDDYSRECADAHLDFLQDAGAKFNRDEALDLFEQAVAEKD